MNKEQKFTALVSVYMKDRLDWLKEAVDSLFTQTAVPSEIVFIADGPLTPQMEAYLRALAAEHPFVRNIFLPVNAGRGAALKEAVLQCSNNLIALVDSDDINLPHRFDMLLNAFAQDSALAACGGQIVETDFTPAGRTTGRKVPLTDGEIRRYVLSRSPINQMTVMFRRDMVQKAGGYEPFHLLEDYYLWARMAHCGLKMRNLPDVLVHARVDSNMFKRRGGWKYFKSNKALQDKLYEMGLISLPRYWFNVCVRFCVQALFPNALREKFYKKVLR